jgi:hypothetical protein
MTMHTFKDFLLSGTLGPIALGDSEEKVRDVLGEPQTTLDPRTWDYDGLAVKFGRTESGRGVLMMHLNLAYAGKKLPDGLRLTGVPSPALPARDFERHLDDLGLKKGVHYQRLPPKGDSERFEMTSSGVEAMFNDGKLLWVVASALKQPKGKQLAVFIPDDIVELIRKEATQRKVTMAALCSEWITEHARSVMQH